MAYYNNLIGLISKLYPDYLVWNKKTSSKIIYLTFDDGPVPEVTEYVLAQLAKHQVKATFFCVGANVAENPEIFFKIINQGHVIGNHTHNHLNGWNTENALYLENVQACQSSIDTLLQKKELNSSQILSTNLFRPPYGKIKRSQINALKNSFKIIMWDVLTGDFDKNQSEEDCLKLAVRYTKPGSIVIFHDSIKAKKNLYYALPLYLKYFIEKGYQFKTL